MGTHMKTTIELSDVLFTSVKELASRSQTTMRALVEEGLRRVLNDAKAPIKPAFKLRDASVQGKAVLISDTARWRQMEDEHVIQRVTRSGT